MTASILRAADRIIMPVRPSFPDIVLEQALVVVLLH
jgi:hypothetical protein